MNQCKQCLVLTEKLKFYEDKAEKLRQKRRFSGADYYKNNKSKLIKLQNLYNKNRDQGLYRKYWAAISRCNYKTNSRYPWYGGRGIKFLWDSYPNFKKDMSDLYLKHVEVFGFKDTTLDRINVNGNYCKENCRWATRHEQSMNKRNSKIKQ